MKLRNKCACFVYISVPRAAVILIFEPLIVHSINLLIFRKIGTTMYGPSCADRIRWSFSEPNGNILFYYMSNWTNFRCNYAICGLNLFTGLIWIWEFQFVLYNWNLFLRSRIQQQQLSADMGTGTDYWIGHYPLLSNLLYLLGINLKLD